MSSDDRKRKQVERYLRQTEKHVSYEEQRRRKGAAKGRPSGRSGGNVREREFTEDAEVPLFEKIPRGPRGASGTSRASGTGKAGASGHGVIDASLSRSTVIAVHRGRLVLEGEREARLAGRLAADPDLRLVVGDVVAWSEHSGVARIEGVLPRRSSLARGDPGNAHRELVIAANVDVAVIVVAAADPPLRPGLIDRYLLGLERGGVAAVICVNKLDLIPTADVRAELEQLLQPYAQLGLPIVRVSASTGSGLDELRDQLRGRTCVLVGHSGVGKSSLLNRIDPGEARATGAVRSHGGGDPLVGGRGGGRGRHTTTSSSLRDLGQGTRVIDTPGVRAFGLEHLTPEQVLGGFPDLIAFSADCRYSNCTHLDEAECGVRAAVADGRASESRYKSFRRVLAEG